MLFRSCCFDVISELGQSQHLSVPATAPHGYQLTPPSPQITARYQSHPDTSSATSLAKGPGRRERALDTDILRERERRRAREREKEI